MKNKLSYLLICLLTTVFIFGCKSGNATTEKNNSNNSKDIVWAKVTSTKLDFIGKTDNAKEVVVKDDELSEIILKAVESGEMKAYDSLDDKLLSKKAIAKIFASVDTVDVLNPETEDMERKLINNELNRQEVKKFRMVQKWSFDAESKTFDSEVVSVAPLLSVYNDDFSYRGDLPLFKVYFSGPKAN